MPALESVLQFCRSVHMLCLTVWLGGLIFQGMVFGPMTKDESADVRRAARRAGRRFTTFLWTGLLAMMVFGLFMVLIRSRFMPPSQGVRYWGLFTVKQVIFVLILLVAFVYTRMLRYLDTPASNGGYDERAELYRSRLARFRTLMIVLGIGDILITEAMVQSG